MADKSAIEWTEATWNPTTGCDRISSGCDHCYALTLAKRLKAMGSPKYQVDGDPRTSGPGFGVAIHADALDVPYRWREPRTVFVNSMSDLFHARVPLAYVRRVFEVMRKTPRHTYQVLTKRAARLARLAPEIDWPANVWMGVSVEDASQTARVDHLRTVPAAVRFVSAEPLLGPLPGLDLDGVDWLIAGANREPDVGTCPPTGCVTCGISARWPGRRSFSSSGAVVRRRPVAGRWTAGPGTRCRCGGRSLSPGDNDERSVAVPAAAESESPLCD
ncbi:hypothetical protein GCM10027605_08750 [Micromonospora zhanjiangensis]